MAIATLGIKVSSSDAKTADKNLDGLAAAANRADTSVNKLNKSTPNMAKTMRSAAIAVGAVTAAVSTLGAAMRGAETYTGITNSFLAMGQSGDEVAETLSRIAQIANDTRSPLESVAKLYQRISVAGKDLGATSEDVAKFTENVGMALAASGTSANEASGALLQLSQAMAGGVVRAEEFNSILEGAYPIAQAAANGIDGAAGSVGRLRAMVVEGEISSKQFFDAILSQSDELQAAFSTTAATVGQAATVMSNKFTMLVGEMDSTFGITESIANLMLGLSENMRQAAVYVGSFAAVMTGLMVPSIYAAVAGFVTLRGVMMASGIGAVVVALGYAANKAIDFAESVGGVGQAVIALRAVASEAFGRIAQSFNLVPQAIAIGAAKMSSFFAKAIGTMAYNFVEFTWTIAEGLNNLFGSNLSGASGVITQELNRVAIAADETAASATNAFNSTLAAVAAPLSSLNDLAEAQEKIRRISENNNDSGGVIPSITDPLADSGSSGGGGSSAAAKLSEDAQALEGILESLKSEQDKYNESISQADRLLKAGALSTEQYALHVAQLTDEFRDTQFGEMRNEIDGITDALFEGKDALKDYVSNALIEFAKLQFSSGLQSLLGIGSATSGGSGFMSGLGSLLSFDGGGYTGSGSRSGGIDGKGGGLAVLHPNETVIDHTKSGSSGGTSASFTVANSMDSSGNLTTLIRDQAGKVLASQTAGIVSQSVTASSKAARSTKGFFKS